FRDLRARRRLRLAPGLGRAPPAGRAAHRRRPSPARARRAGGPGRGPRALPALGGEADLRGRRARQGHARGARRPDRQGPREEAVDFACLDALVERRRAHGLPAPVADSARDRDEFTQRVRTFLAELRDAVATDLTPEQRRKVDAAARAAGDETGRLLAVQVAL